jgi:NADPH:quinone reductase-like Zn-dependent oxidoreductase
VRQWFGRLERTTLDLLFLKDLIERLKVKPVIDRRYSLGDVPEAIRYVEAGHARGKVVVTIAIRNPATT